eukprot:scaffold20036_cov112-Isochrysis_galbana.AAC.1
MSSIFCTSAMVSRALHEQLLALPPRVATPCLAVAGAARGASRRRYCRRKRHETPHHTHYYLLEM